MRKQLSDQDLDALVTRSLARLPYQAPTGGFAGRVMDRVQLPPARALVAFRRAKSWALQPRRAAALAGSYAVLAVLTLGVVVPWVLANAAGIRFALDWTAGRVITVGRDIAMSAASWTVSTGIADMVRSIPLSGASMWAVIALIAAAYAGAAFGLHVLLRAPRGDKNEPVNSAA